MEPVNEISNRLLSDQNFLNLGAPNVAYIRPIQRPDKAEVFGVFSANGQQLNITSGRAAAFAFARQNDLWPLDVN